MGYLNQDEIKKIDPENNEVPLNEKVKILQDINVKISNNNTTKKADYERAQKIAKEVEGSVQDWSRDTQSLVKTFVKNTMQIYYSLPQNSQLYNTLTDNARAIE
jgi:malate synthase